MNVVISFIGTLIIFGLLMMVLSLKARRDAQRSAAPGCGHSNVCQCRRAQHAIEMAQTKKIPEK